MQKICTQCQTDFEVTEADQLFLDKISPVFNGVKYSIPAPSLCFECRHRRRITFRNDRNLYQRKCDGSGDMIISTYSPDKPFKVYGNRYWWSDAWDECSYGRDFDFSRSFSEQFRELQLVVPRLSMMNDDGVQSTNCQYCQDFAYGKNCYLVFGSWQIEDSLYSEHVEKCKDIVDCLLMFENSELAYECINCSSVYQSAFLENCLGSSDCFFGYDLVGCRNCFGCVGLRQKEHHIFNQPYSKEEYLEKMKSFDMGSYAALENMKTQFSEFLQKLPRKEHYNRNCENSSGNYLLNSKDSTGFEFANAEDARYCVRGATYRNCMDMYQSGLAQWSYNCVTCDEGYMNMSSLYCWKGKSNLYSDTCQSCENVFGCISMKKKKYCILNKQYSKEEYENLVPKIIEHMGGTLIVDRLSNQGKDSNDMNDKRQTINASEWGEFFPSSISPFAYNETLASDYFPLTKEECELKGFEWTNTSTAETQNLASVFPVPDKISQVGDDISKEMLVCQKTGKKYKILPQELAFYRKMNLPVPRLAPSVRHLNRIAKMNPRKLWDRQCAKCSKEMKTSYAPERSEIVYCEECYLKEMY